MKEKEVLLNDLFRDFQISFSQAAPEEKERLAAKFYEWAKQQADGLGVPIANNHPQDMPEGRNQLPSAEVEGFQRQKFEWQDVQTLVKNEIHLRQMVENIEQVVWLRDIDTDRILYVSPAFETVWGRSCESFYADPLTLIKSVHPEDRVKVISDSLVENRRYTNQSYRILRSDGTLRWISAHSFLIHEESSDISYQVCVAQDITEQKQLDQVLQKALDRSREQFTLSHRMSLAVKPEAVLKTLMSASELRTAKRAFVLFFETQMGGPAHEIEVITSWSSEPYPTSPIPNDVWNAAGAFEDFDLMDFFHPTRPVVVTEISRNRRLTPVLRHLLLEGQIQTVATFPLIVLGKWVGSLLLFFPQEKYFETIEKQHIKVLVDQSSITLYNLRLLEIEAESRQEAEQANEIKTRFLAMISHELRTPLTSIKGFTITLLAEDVVWEPEEQRDFILTIQQETTRLQELIDHLLDLSRLEAGMLPIALEPGDLHKIIEDALPQIHSLTSLHTLTMHLPDTLPLVNADAKRVAQVLVNLVRNAATYAPKGTEISISASVRGGFMRINVNDQGPGIRQAEHKRVFRAFQRGVNMEKGPSEGAGLGLAICKGLVEAHGGRIWIKKKSTPGATVSFTIPLVSFQNAADPEEEEL
jgi:PAS domain S-box-containing protein